MKPKLLRDARVYFPASAQTQADGAMAATKRRTSSGPATLKKARFGVVTPLAT